VVIVLERNRCCLDMSSEDLDGSHTTALRVGECSGYQSNIECCISRLAVNSEFSTLYLCCKANNRLLLS